MNAPIPAPTGTLEWRRGKARLRLSLGSFGRRMLTLATCRTEAEAEERRALICRLADRLVASGQIAIGFPLLETAAKRDGRALEDVVKALDSVSKGEARARSTGETTIRALAKQWTSGELAKLYPDHVREKSTAEDDAQRLDHYVLPIVGDLAVARFTLDHAEEIMRRVPRELAPRTRRQIAQALHRLMVLAVFPLRLIAANPLPRGFLPSLRSAKAKSYLYPDEESTVLACREIVLVRRVLYGFLAREGLRAGEAEKLTWNDLDLERGAIRLDTNKTDDPRAWSLRRDVVRALRVWRDLQRAEAAGGDDAPVFPVTFACAARRFRENLERAGITRAELFEVSKARLPIRMHDLRATFITIGMANGKTEAWIQDRTGHKSSTMVNLYRRAARTAAELELGDLAPLDLAIPEIAALLPPSPDPAPAGEQAPSQDACPKVPVEAPEPGTGLVRAAPGVVSGNQEPYKTSVSAHAEPPRSVSKSAIRKGLRVRVPPSVPERNHSGNGGVPEGETEGGSHGPYQIRTSTPGDAAGEPVGKGAPATGRAGVVARLAGELAALAAAGDLEGARVVQETIGRLLSPVVRSGEDAAGAVVVDLEAERERRAGRL